jgi:hypothetical protein
VQLREAEIVTDQSETIYLIHPLGAQAACLTDFRERFSVKAGQAGCLRSEGMNQGLGSALKGQFQFHTHLFFALNARRDQLFLP